MKTFKLINILVPSFFVLVTAINTYAMDPSVAKEYCTQEAVDEGVPGDERYDYIKDCINSISDEEVENYTITDEVEVDKEGNKE